MVKYIDNITSLVGNTPLIKLRQVSEETGCNILGKAEFLNPGQSVKDRAALWIIRDAEKKGLLEKGGLIVEGTAGNTGIGLTVIGQALGYKTLIVMPETQSEEKKSALRDLGAKLMLVPALPYSNPNNYIRYSEKVAIEKNAFWANQFDNTANKLAHIESTSVELWKQTDQNINGFVAAVGTGGTLAGTAEGLKHKNRDITIICADPYGSGMYSWIKKGKPNPSGSSITEGIGQSRITNNLKDAKIDDSYQIEDKEALDIIFNLLKNEGLSLGPSSGINIAGAVKLAKKLGPGHTIATILCDNGTRYASKIYNKKFLESKQLPIPSWLE
jgi:cysteine synthase A